MKIKFLGLSLIGCILLSGCSSMNSINANFVGYGFMPDNQKEIDESLKIEKDNFKNITKVSTIPYAIIPEYDTEQIPIKVLYRLNVNENNKLSLLQLYFIKTHSAAFGLDDNKWGFYNEVVGQDGYKFDFVKIDKEITIDRNPMTFNPTGVDTNETFAININISQLIKMSDKDYSLKIYGSKKEGVVKIPKHFSSSILYYIQKNNIKQ